MAPPPEELLACALTYRDAPRRVECVPDTFASTETAFATWTAVLLHEAHEALAEPLSSPPTELYLHPVDVDTIEPGIVDRRDGTHVLRCDPSMPRVAYTRKTTSASFIASTPRPSRTAHEANDAAAKELVKHIAREEKKAATQERRAERLATKREERAAETSESRVERLAAQREARANAPKRPRTAKPPPPPPTDDALLDADVSTEHAVRSLRPRRKGKVHVFEHPLPHHRHLLGVQASDPSPELLGALLRAEPSDALEIIDGPPGTGKTRALITRARDATGLRLLLCAPTNVGAANLYRQCLNEGVGDDTSLVMAPDRVPSGTPVGSADPSRRIVCATISARSGALMNEPFDAVFVDEAAQCMEAWVWTLLRPSVRRLVLAGDARQLPALVSNSGRALAHDRSLPQRLLELGYKNVTRLVEQHRMAPELLRNPNARFYDGALRCGAGAPRHGAVELVRVEGTEERVGTSFRNAVEADAAVAAAVGDDGVVFLAPYAAHVQLLLSKKTGREVHTVDAFQGREAETVVLCLVRDGSTGLGFWDDTRRLNVALTRARTRLVVVGSCDEVLRLCG